jgi:sulfite exporter TauE/SafE
VVLVISALRLLRTKSASRPLQITKKRKVGVLSRLFATLVDEPLLLGAFTALLPCGALGAALLLAASTGHPVTGALAMSTFAAITGVGLVGASVLSAKLAPTRLGRRALAGVLIVGTLILVWRPLSGIGSDGPSCHGALHTENR